MTIRLRLTIAFVGMLALLMVLRGVIAVEGFRQAMESEAEHQVSSRVKAVADYIILQNDAHRRARPPERLDWSDPETLPEAFSEDGMLIQISRKNGKILAQSLNLGTRQLPLISAGLHRSHVLAAGEPLLILMGTRPVDLKGQSPIVVQVALPIARMESAVSNHLMIEITVGVLSLLFALIASYVMAGRALKPTAKLNDEMQALTATDLHKRLPAPPNPRDEMERLAATFNGLLDRIEASFEMQTRFVADASHELKSPLTAIQGYHQLLAKRGAAHPEKAQEWLRIASQETERLSRLVDELLLLARADEGQLSRHTHKAVRLDAIVRDTVASFSALYPRVRLAGLQEAIVRADADHLTRLLRNLIDNALRATQAGGTVDVALAIQGSQAAVTVADTGTGIPEAVMPHLFGRFYRADRARDRERGGAGLGLAICQAIVKAHGGEIAVRSVEGKGTTFSVRLPLANAWEPGHSGPLQVAT